jgi:hypothetical protein
MKPVTNTANEDALMEKAREFYDTELRRVLEPEHTGEFVAIDPETGAYAVGPDPTILFEELNGRGSTSLKALLRVGHDWAFDLLRHGA